MKKILALVIILFSGTSSANDLDFNIIKGLSDNISMEKTEKYFCDSYAYMGELFASYNTNMFASLIMPREELITNARNIIESSFTDEQSLKASSYFFDIIVNDLSGISDSTGLKEQCNTKYSHNFITTKNE